MITINALGQACPLPVINAKKAIKSMTTDGTLIITVDNKIAAENLEKLSVQLNCNYSLNKLGEECYEVTIIKGKGDNTETLLKPPLSFGELTTVVAITGDAMGKGSEELGKALMKSFLYALTEQESLPDKVIFYNSGIKLVTEGSTVLEDIKKLESLGVEILACGACLNYYHLTEKLAVGSITNMYTILESLLQAGKVIYP